MHFLLSNLNHLYQCFTIELQTNLNFFFPSSHHFSALAPRANCVLPLVTFLQPHFLCLCRMKGDPYKLRLRSKELSLILIFLVCATILIWTWDGIPVLTSSLPNKNQLLQLSPGLFQAILFLSCAIY